LDESANKKAAFERGAKPDGLVPPGAMRRASRLEDGPARGVVCASWNAPFDKLRTGFRGRFAVPQGEVVGIYK
jgi:hypothetical protein